MSIDDDPKSDPDVGMANKICTKCRQTKQLVEFYTERRNKDGRCSSCKVCQGAATKAYRVANPEKCRESHRKWRGCNQERVRKNARAYAERNTPLVRARIREWRHKNPEKRRAHDAVRRALDGGRLTRPAACEGCGRVYRANAGLHGHHDDYAKQLEVIWLCSQCHRKRHLDNDLRQTLTPKDQP